MAQDLAALAAKMGGVSSPTGIDFAKLAQQNGGTSTAPTASGSPSSAPASFSVNPDGTIALPSSAGGSQAPSTPAPSSAYSVNPDGTIALPSGGAGAPASSAPAVPTTLHKAVDQVASGLKSDTEAHAGNIVQDLSQKPSFTGALDVAGNVAGEVGDFFGEPLKAAVSALPDPIKNGLKTAVSKVVGTPEAQAVVSAWNKLQAQHPDATKNIGNVVNIAALMGGDIGGEAAGVPTAEETATAAKGAAKDAIDTTVQGAKDLKSSATDALQEKYINQEKVAWSAPTIARKAGFAKATTILKNAAKGGNDIPDQIVKDGITTSKYIDGGSYATAEAADSVRADAGKLSSDSLRTALQAADKSPNAPITPVSDIKIPESLIQAQGKKVTADNVEQIQGLINSKLSSLESKYPDGLKLTDLHDQKIVYAANGKYIPGGDAMDNNSIANRSIASVLGKTLENKAPEGVPVEAVNQYLQKQYQVADYLDELNNKKVPITKWAQARNEVGKIGGVMAANAIGGPLGIGGVLVDVAGYHFGGIIESMLENMSSPLKNSILAGIKESNPDAFAQIEKYIAQGGTPTLALPAAPLGTNSGQNQAVFPAIQDRSMIPTQIDKPAPGGLGNYQSLPTGLPKAEGAIPETSAIPKTGKPYTAIEYRGQGKSGTGGNAFFGDGLYTTPDKDVAKSYGDVKPIKVSLKNPYVLTDPTEINRFAFDPKYRASILSKGYDGVIVRGPQGSFTMYGENQTVSFYGSGTEGVNPP